MFESNYSYYSRNYSSNRSVSELALQLKDGCTPVECRRGFRSCILKETISFYGLT